MNVIHVDGRALNRDAHKTPLALLPHTALWEVADVFGCGAAKYAPENWRRGMAYSRMYSSLLRHLFAWWTGEETDSETGHHHLAHAACRALMLLEMTSDRAYDHYDDRPRVEPEALPAES